MTSPKRYTDIFVKFKDGTSDKDVETGMEKIRGISGVFNAEALFPGEKDPSLKLMQVVTVNLVQAEDARLAMKKVKNVQYADYGAKRKLMRP